MTPDISGLALLSSQDAQIVDEHRIGPNHIDSI